MKALIRPFIYIVSALMALSFASCNDFLDKEPEGKVPEEKVDYTDISNMYQPVSGVYAKIRTSGLHWVIWEITTIRDQDVFSGQWNGSDYYNLSEYKYNDSFCGCNTTISSKPPMQPSNHWTYTPRISPTTTI